MNYLTKIQVFSNQRSDLSNRAFELCVLRVETRKLSGKDSLANKLEDAGHQKYELSSTQTLYIHEYGVFFLLKTIQE